MSSPQQLLMAGDRGPLLAFASWLIMSLMCLATGTKIATKLSRVGIFQIDDAYMTAAMLAAIGHSIAVYEAVNSGLGEDSSTLTQSQINGVEQAIYAGQMLYILSLCFAKLALLQIYNSFARTKLRSSVVTYSKYPILLWAFVAFFTIAFQCRLPDAWAVFSSDQCINQPAFWDVIGFFDILTDIGLATLPIWLLYDLQLPIGKRAVIMIAFTERIFVIPLTILRLVYITSSANSTNPTNDVFNAALVTVINVNISIILACIPFLKPFLDSLQIGMFNSDPRFLVTRGNRVEDGSGYYEIERSQGSGGERNSQFPLASWGGKRKSDGAKLGPSVRSNHLKTPEPSLVRGLKR